MVVDHLSGDATNNNLSNLGLNCPACDQIRHCGLAGINGTIQIYETKLTQLEIVDKTHSFYLKNKRLPQPRELDKEAKYENIFPVQIAVAPGEKKPTRVIIESEKSSHFKSLQIENSFE
jgi:hypothetical protein